ncbi:unnamed protein product [Arctogadus glacialis]
MKRQRLMRRRGLKRGLEEIGLALERRDGGSYCCPVTKYISSPCDRAVLTSAAALQTLRGRGGARTPSAAVPIITDSAFNTRCPYSRCGMIRPLFQEHQSARALPNGFTLSTLSTVSSPRVPPEVTPCAAVHPATYQQWPMDHLWVFIGRLCSGGGWGLLLECTDTPGIDGYDGALESKAMSVLRQHVTTSEMWCPATLSRLLQRHSFLD